MNHSPIAPVPVPTTGGWGYGYDDRGREIHPLADVVV